MGIRNKSLGALSMYFHFMHLLALASIPLSAVGFAKRISNKKEAMEPLDSMNRNASNMLVVKPGMFPFPRALFMWPYAPHSEAALKSLRQEDRHVFENMYIPVLDVVNGHQYDMFDAMLKEKFNFTHAQRKRILSRMSVRDVDIMMHTGDRRVLDIALQFGKNEDSHFRTEYMKRVIDTTYGQKTKIRQKKKSPTAAQA